VRYLAIVQRKRFLGQQELQLLAKELGEYSWTAAQGEISSDLVGRFSPGTLVIADVGPNNAIQRIEDAADHLVALLQSFSRFSESFKAQVEEIESWKQSLIYQSQELSRREAELLVRAQELEMQLAQVGALGPDEVDFIRETAEVDPPLSPSAFATEQERLRLREQSIEAMELKLTERTRELESQCERLRAQQEDLQREREALHQQWEQHSASAGRLSAAQVSQLQAYLQTLYNQGDASEEGLLADDRLTWQTDWQACAEMAAQLAREAQILAERQQQFECAWQEHLVARAVHQTNRAAWEQQSALVTQQLAAVDALERGRQAPAPAPVPTGVDSENVAQLQRQLREQQREYQQRASLVLQQEEELHAQEEHMRHLRERLTQANLSGDEREEIQEELEFEEQRCLILRESLSQQQSRLQVEQEKVNAQVARLQALVGHFDAEPTDGDPLVRLRECLRTALGELERNHNALEAEAHDIAHSAEQLARQREHLDAERTDHQERESDHQRRLSELQARQVELEKRQAAIDARVAFGRTEARPLIDGLDGLLRSLQVG